MPTKPRLGRSRRESYDCDSRESLGRGLGKVVLERECSVNSVLCVWGGGGIGERRGHRDGRRTMRPACVPQHGGGPGADGGRGGRERYYLNAPEGCQRGTHTNGTAYPLPTHEVLTQVHKHTNTSPMG